MNLLDEIAFKEKWHDIADVLNRFGKLPDMEGILYLIGINELGDVPRKNLPKSKSKTSCMWQLVPCWRKVVIMNMMGMI